MNESIEKQKESLENIINAVTAKEDVVLSLEDSKRRVQEKKKLLDNDLENISGLSLTEQKKLFKFVKRLNSPFYIVFVSIIKGMFFALGALITLFLLNLMGGSELINFVVDLFSSAMTLFK